MLARLVGGELCADFLVHPLASTVRKVFCCFQRHGFQLRRVSSWSTNLIHTLALALLAGSLVAQRPTVVIWPIKPVLEEGQKSTAVWIENRGSQPLTLQARIVGWNQESSQDNFANDQESIAVSPPLSTINPGIRQLLRIVRLKDAAPGHESAFRLLVDELPEANVSTQAEAPAPTAETSMGVKFRMRYSLPVFVRGHGFKSLGDPAKAAQAVAEGLRWKTVVANQETWLEVYNPSHTHARLTAVRLLADEKEYDIAKGLLGYVLPGSTMRWRMPDTVPSSASLRLQAKVNGTETVLKASR
jgi:P pilus assembly chaperone PapD